MGNKGLIIAVFAMLLSLPALADGPQLINNGGFDSGVGTSAFGWTLAAGGALSQRSAVQPASGSFALRIAGTFGSGSAVQTVTSGIIPSSPFRFSASVAAPDKGGNFNCQVAFFDVSNQLLGSPFALNLTPAALTASHQTFTLQDIVPANAASAQIGAGINNLTGLPGDGRFDDISLVMVPEPACATIILIVAALMRRRR